VGQYACLNFFVSGPKFTKFADLQNY